MSTTQQLHPGIISIHHQNKNTSLNISAMSLVDGINAMEESSSVALPIHGQVSSSPLDASADTQGSSAPSSSDNDMMMGGLFSQEYMNMEKPSIVLKPFQFSSSMMDGETSATNWSMNNAQTAPPSYLASKQPLNTTVSYCNLFESYAVEPLPSSSSTAPQTTMACISDEGEDDAQSRQSTNGSFFATAGGASRSASEETMGSTKVMMTNSSASNPSFITSAPSFVASVHDPWATLSDRTSIITAAATAASSSNASRRSKSKSNLTNAISSTTLYAQSSPEKKRSRLNLQAAADAPKGEEEEEEEEEAQQHPSHRLRKRHAEKGAFTFRENGEYELMMHVQRGLPPNFNRLSPLDSSNLILDVVDVYCQEEQWMFHIGQDKGLVLKTFLEECTHSKKEQFQFQRKHSMEEGADEPPPLPSVLPPLILVEVGTYCGYSAILLAKSMYEIDPALKFHIYTVETNSQNIMVASSMILMSKFHEHITILHHQPANESLSSLVKRKLKQHTASACSRSVTSNNGATATASSTQIPQADFVFFDHDKERYLDHLIQFEVNGIIQKGTHVAADNVLFHRLDGYRHHMTKLQRKGITTTKMVQISLEYCDEEDDVRDGIELTSYLKDPVLRRP